MDRVTAAGAGLTLLAVVGYLVATVVPYPGRSATLPGVMVGLTLLAVGGAAGHDVTGTVEPADEGGYLPDSDGDRRIDRDDDRRLDTDGGYRSATDDTAGPERTGREGTD